MTVPTISHIEWFVIDLNRSVAFLNGLFGWQFEVFSEHYRLYTPESGPRVGLMEVAAIKPCEATFGYVTVDDIERYLQRAEQLGGCVVTGRSEIPNYGWYAQIADPDGNRVGLFQAWISQQ
ncbi:MAG: VOC family protein [Candidatus Competibacteraceae bacterium]|nr:VOC family protein [Candidatus Competibacteraceae bacterium]